MRVEQASDDILHHNDEANPDEQRKVTKQCECATHSTKDDGETPRSTRDHRNLVVRVGGDGHRVRLGRNSAPDGPEWSRFHGRAPALAITNTRHCPTAIPPSCRCRGSPAIGQPPLAARNEKGMTSMPNDERGRDRDATSAPISQTFGRRRPRQAPPSPPEWCAPSGHGVQMNAAATTRRRSASRALGAPTPRPPADEPEGTNGK